VLLGLFEQSRTREAPTPTNISTKSEPTMVKKGNLASPAMAREQRFLAGSGEPTVSTPSVSCRQVSGTCRDFQEIDDFDNFLRGLLDPATSAKVMLT